MRASAESYVAAQNGAVALAVGELRAFWSRRSGDDPVAVREALEEWWPSLIRRYGDVVVTLAADRFEDVTGLPAVLAEPARVGAANARMRWAVGPLFGAAGTAWGRMVVLVDELVKEPGRATMIGSARQHGMRFARVPSGPVTCAWCLMLASRGFVYADGSSAMAVSHGKCDCRIAVEDEDTGNYDPEGLFAAYEAARREAGGDPADILAALRRREGIR